MPVLNTPPGNAAALLRDPELALDDRMAGLLVWLGELIQQNGAGEYIVSVAQDGHVTVKRPRKPLEFHYGG